MRAAKRRKGAGEIIINIEKYRGKTNGKARLKSLKRLPLETNSITATPVLSLGPGDRVIQMSIDWGQPHCNDKVLAGGPD
ncbi:MAG: hypothetical protein IPG67_16840 [Acidobacteria bacterium]|nr:hypothetical protein [Acidobacteriota bacterium]